MKNMTELVIIIDKSGSMYPLSKDVIGGYNSLITSQSKLEGEVKVTTIFFNNEVKIIHDGVDIKEINPLDGRSYQPNGCTALLDAIGDAIMFIKAKHSKLKAKQLPEHTIFSIMTDGLENASREYTYKRVKDMIELQKKCGWEFIFQAANIDTEYEADRLGINRDSAFSFDASTHGVYCMMERFDGAISKLRKASKNNKDK